MVDVPGTQNPLVIIVRLYKRNLSSIDFNICHDVIKNELKNKIQLLSLYSYLCDRKIYRRHVLNLSFEIEKNGVSNRLRFCPMNNSILVFLWQNTAQKPGLQNVN